MPDTLHIVLHIVLIIVIAILVLQVLGFAPWRR